MQKTYVVSKGPLTIHNVPPARVEVDDVGNVTRIPAGSVWFDESGRYVTDSAAEQMALDAHPEVYDLATWEAMQNPTKQPPAAPQVIQ